MVIIFVVEATCSMQMKVHVGNLSIPCVVFVV